MKEKYRQLPEILKRRVLERFAGGIAALILFIVIQFYYREFYFSLPCLLLSTLALISSGQLLYSCLREEVLCIRGICRQVETAGFQKRMKSIYVDTGSGRLKISVYRKIKALAQGDTVNLYLTKKTPVYEQDGRYVVCSYFALTKENRTGNDSGIIN